MFHLTKRLILEDEGASAIEYGLIAGLVAVVLIGALTLTGTSLQGVFSNIANQLAALGGGGGGGGTP